MVKFALIGGRTNKDERINKMEEFIFSLTKKAKPNVLFCPYGTKDYYKTNKKFTLLVEGLNINLRLMTEKDYLKFDDLLKDADIFYISGGCSNDLVAIFMKYNYDKILYKYLNTNKIYAGISAGAMLYTKCSMGDRDMFIDCFHKYNYKMVEGLGLLDISICPHYQEEDLIVYNDEVKRIDYISFGIENDTLLFIDNKKYSVFKEDKTKSVYYFGKNKIMTPMYEGELYEEDSSFRS